MGERDLTEVDIYTTPFCGFCYRAKALLEGKGVRFTEIDVTVTPGARQEMMDRAGVWVHHKRRATTSGSLATPPFGSLFPLPRGVGKACRWPRIAYASPPAGETGKAIVGVQFS